MSNTARVKAACYTTNMSMSVISNTSPILFLTFHSLYGVSYSLLGLLVLINFISQLTVDLIFSFFSHRFNIPKAVKSAPVLAFIGLAIYALWPYVFPNYVYAGLVIGTIISSAASGFAEVLISPVIAALPADDPDREMSKLHSVYAWGVVGVVVIGTLFLLAFGNRNWQILVLLLTLIPLSSAILFSKAELPVMSTPEKASVALSFFKNKTLWLCFVGIFLGGASECVMAQWASGYIEAALRMPKVWGDLFGVAMFSAAMGVGRSLYAKRGKNINKVLLVSAIGAAVCYLTAAVSPVPVIGLVACALTGLCIAMLWPGSLVVASDRFPTGGVFIYALMAAGGDLGGAVGPELIGVIADAFIANPKLTQLAASWSLTPDQLGLKAGMLVGMLFPLIAIPVYSRLRKTKAQ